MYAVRARPRKHVAGLGRAGRRGRFDQHLGDPGHRMVTPSTPGWAGSTRSRIRAGATRWPPSCEIAARLQPPEREGRRLRPGEPSDVGRVEDGAAGDQAESSKPGSCQAAWHSRASRISTGTLWRTCDPGLGRSTPSTGATATRRRTRARRATGPGLEHKRRVPAEAAAAGRASRTSSPGRSRSPAPPRRSAGHQVRGQVELS